MEVVEVAQLLRSAACLHTNQSRSYLNHLVPSNKEHKKLHLVGYLYDHYFMLLQHYLTFKQLREVLSCILIVSGPHDSQNEPQLSCFC